MKVLNALILITFLLVVQGKAAARQNILPHSENSVIFGQDDRSETYQIRNARIQQAANSTAMLIHSTKLAPAEPQLFQFQNLSTLKNAFGLANGERFEEQPAIGSCSGVLVAPNIIVTAGHCYENQPNYNHLQDSAELICRDFYWAFDVKMKTNGNFPRVLTQQNVYRCEKILYKGSLETTDLAIIQLSRNVIGKRPVSLNPNMVTPHSRLTLAGYPMGLPQKIASNGRVIGYRDEEHFFTNVDAFVGNSGSPVINESTGLVEGIIVAGQADFYHDRSRGGRVTNHCDEYGTNCNKSSMTKTETVISSNTITAILQAIYRP